MAYIFRAFLIWQFIILSIFLCIIPNRIYAQKYNRQDTLRGSLRPERNAYKVHHYELNLTIDPVQKYISGYCKIDFTFITEKTRIFQIDLFPEYTVDSIIANHKKLTWRQEGNVLWVARPTTSPLIIYYQGKPVPAKLPPWSGGFVWSQDKSKNPWVGVACENMGASAWWPLKDHLSEEPDSMTLNFTVPSGLTCVSNGELKDTIQISNTQTLWKWKVYCPINNYNVSFNLGKFHHFTDIFPGLNGPLKTDFYVLENNARKSQKYFRKETPKMLKAFEYYFGPYPCYTDGYGLVETPYYGMEHQGAIAYGNNLQKLKKYKFDFILVHESGHEWWGNSISCSDHAEMWIHEGFTTYSEALYVEYYQGKKKSLAYLNLQKSKIKNTSPLIGPMGINFSDWGDSDNYYKGTWFVNTLRHVLHDDVKWLDWLKTFTSQNRYTHQTTESIRESLENVSGINLKPIFSQYLEDVRIPVLEIYSDSGGTWKSRWKNSVPGFNLPVFIHPENSERIDPDAENAISKKWINSKIMRKIENMYLIKIEIGK